MVTISITDVVRQPVPPATGETGGGRVARPQAESFGARQPRHSMIAAPTDSVAACPGWRTLCSPPRSGCGDRFLVRGVDLREVLAARIDAGAPVAGFAAA